MVTMITIVNNVYKYKQMLINSEETSVVNISFYQMLTNVNKY